MENITDEHRDDEVEVLGAPDGVGEEQKKPFWFSRTILTSLILLIVLGILTAILVLQFKRSQEAIDRTLCQNNLKMLAKIIAIYSEGSPQKRFPPAVCIDGVWTVDLRSIYPKILSDLDILICPCIKDCNTKKEVEEALKNVPTDWDTIHRFLAEQYVYLPWVVENENAFLELIGLPNISKLSLDEDTKSVNHAFRRLREGIARFYITDIGNPSALNSTAFCFPIVFDNPGTTAHFPKGINVLYLDGHVEFVEFGSRYPATQAVWDYFTEKTAAIKNEP